MSFTTTARINLAALQHNLAAVHRLAPGCKVVAMIKANAYGHGLTAIAHALEHVDALGVARIHEAIQLRKAGIEKPIILMEGFFEAWELPMIVQYHLDIVVHQPAQLHALTQQRLAAPVRAWLKLDSGMHRLGFAPDEFLAAWQSLHDNPNILPDIILMTHFACADEPDNNFTLEQWQLFNELTQRLPGSRSLANSAAIIAWPQTHYSGEMTAQTNEWVRPGIMLYGISPFAGKTGKNLGLQPVMSLHSRLLNIKHYPKHESIGYGGEFTCPEAMAIGLVAIGYGDGYPRYIPAQGTPVLVNGQLTQVIGRVSMDMIHVDLRPIKNAKIGDDVQLWGEDLPVEQVAHAAHTSSYELVCGITSRVEYINV